MAETLVNLMLGKLCDAVFQEIVFLCGVDDRAELVKRELNRIQCFLRDADRKCKHGRDEGVKNWVNELRNVSFSIEDTIDTFLVEVDGLKSEDPDFMDKIKRKKKGIKDKCMMVIKNPKKAIAIHKFGKEIDKILARIDEITKSREKFGIKNLDESSGSEVKEPVKRPIIPDCDETELVGFGAEKEKIIEQLLDETILRRSVVSITGSGGLGKTTVAQKAYSSNAVKSGFEVRMWLFISQEFKLIDLLKKMLRNFRSITEEEEKCGEEYLMKELYKSLEEKKYLVVLDDVWSNDLWLQIEAVLPDVRNGSRVLMTSRSSQIAKTAGSEPYELPFLNEKESLELLLRTALPSLEANDHLLDIAKQLAQKCDGLPLALVVLGGLLKKKQPTPIAWKKALETIDWIVDGKRCMDILSTSFDDMSLDLKVCFMYLASFPEDHEINARNLIRLWIAEGLIPSNPMRTLEVTAEDYLEQLAERNMMIVVQKRYDNSIKTIRVHDLLRNLAINRAQEDNLITVFSNNDVNGSPSTVPRRVALQSFGGHQLEEHADPNLRSLHCFVRSEDDQVPDCSRYKMLKVYNVEGDGYTTKSLGLEGSTQLRFMRVIEGWTKPRLHLERLKNLETLDLRGLSFDLELHESVWGIETLRHVLLPPLDSIIEVPSWAKLKNLQTLGFVKDSVSWETQLPYLTNVRRLKLHYPSSLETITSLFQTLKNLISLHLLVDSPLPVGLFLNLCPTKLISLDKPDMQAFPFYQYLEKLNLDAQFSHGLDLRTLPPNLIKLRLANSCLERDPMPELEKLQSLKVLILSDTYEGKKMICSAGGFPSLEQLKVSYMYPLVQLEIEEGAMPTLKLLEIVDCPELKSLPMHLTCRIERKD